MSATAASVADAAEPPTAFTGAAAEVTVSSGTQQGSVYPGDDPTSYSFQYGPTVAYGSDGPTTILAAGKQSLHVSLSIPSLTPGTVYQFRLLASNASGAVEGLDRTFTTKSMPLTFTAAFSQRVPYTEPFVLSGVLSGTDHGDRQLLLQGSSFPYISAFAAIAPPAFTDAAGGFSFPLEGLLQSTHVRVATAGAPRVTSSVYTILVAVGVALHVRPTQRRGFARLYGTSTPARPGATVQWQLLRGGEASASVARVDIRTSRGLSRSSRVIRVRRAGRYRGVALVVGTAQVSAHSQEIDVG
jgi:hypothetical protein